jgi:hypothetical protein
MRDSKSASLVFTVKDYSNHAIIFTEKKRKKKSEIHKELLDDKFIKFVTWALTKPTCIWQDYEQPTNKRCYYYRYSGEPRYAKVVVWHNCQEPWQVVSAFDVNWIKEEKYPTLKQIL